MIELLFPDFPFLCYDMLLMVVNWMSFLTTFSTFVTSSVVQFDDIAFYADFLREVKGLLYCAEVGVDCEAILADWNAPVGYFDIA